MNNSELTAALAKLERLHLQEAKIKQEIEEIQDALKGHLTAMHTEEVTHCGWKIAWKDFRAERLDVKTLQKELPQIAAKYIQTTIGKRFTVRKFG